MEMIVKLIQESNPRWSVHSQMYLKFGANIRLMRSLKKENILVDIKALG